MCSLLTIALSFDFGGTDEAEYETILREKGYPEEDIQQFLQVLSINSYQSGITVRFYWAISLSSSSTATNSSCKLPIMAVACKNWFICLYETLEYFNS